MVDIHNIMVKVMVGEKQSFKHDVTELRRNRVHSMGLEYESILHRHTTEDDHTYKWRCENFVPITNGVWERAISSIQRIFRDFNTSIDGSPKLLETLNTQDFGDLTFPQFIQQAVLRTMLDDPNGWLVWLPEPKYDENGVLIETATPEVDPYIVNSTDKVFETDEYIVFEYEGVYYIVTPEEYHIVNVIDKYKQKYEVLYSYSHLLGEIPYIIFGGVYCSKYGYKSFFSSAVDIGNETLRQFSDWQYIMASCGYPIKVVAPLECDVCENGYIHNEHDGSSEKCNKCNGKGTYVPTSPSHILVREKVTNVMGEATTVSVPLLEYVSPSTDILTSSKEAWETLLFRMEYALGVNSTGANQSGVAKVIDREELYSLISAITNNVYENIVYLSLKYIESFVNYQQFTAPTVIKPTNFILKTTDDLAVELTEAMVKALPSTLTNKILSDYTSKRFNGDAVAQRKIDIQILIDPIVTYTEAMKVEYFNIGILTTEVMVTNLLLPSLLDELVQQYGEYGFLELPIDTIYTYVGTSVAQYVSGLEPIPPKAIGLQMPTLTTVDSAAPIVDEDVNTEKDIESTMKKMGMFKSNNYRYKRK